MMTDITNLVRLRKVLSKYVTTGEFQRTWKPWKVAIVMRGSVVARAVPPSKNVGVDGVC